MGNKIIDFLTKDKRYLILLILLVGLILRIIVASNLTPVADEMVHGTHAIGVSKLAPLSTMAQATIWYYFTDYAYRIFGVSLLTARLMSVLFGSLSIILVYLITALIFNKRSGILAASLLAISAFHITWTASYQDMMMMFFVLLASYFFIKLYLEKGKISILSAIFLAVAELIKIITGVFVIVFCAFILFILYKNFRQNKKLFRENLNRFFLFIAILLIALIPIISYNLFLYSQKKIVDLPLAQFLRINPEFYTGPGLHHEEGFVLGKTAGNILAIIKTYLIKEDLLVSLLGITGILYFLFALKKEDGKFERSFFLAMFIFVFLFIASSIVLQTHYTSFFPIFAIFGGALIDRLLLKVKNPKYKKYAIVLTISIILIYNILHLHNPLTSQSATQKLREYTESIEDDALVLVDSRIYVGTYTWALHDKHYLNAQTLFELPQINNSTKPVNVKTYFIECAIDDCGWGTIKDQPELNNSMEHLISEFKSLSTPIVLEGGSSIKGVRGEEVVRSANYRIYQTQLSFNPEALQYVDLTHNHFFYYIPRDKYSDRAFDHYELKGLYPKTLNFLGYSILYFLMVVALIGLFIPLYLLFKIKIK